MVVNETYTLANRVEIPKLGLGTWMIDNEAVVQVVKDALDSGYRHIDTAEAYLNEEGVGHGLKESGVNREDIFVTTKLEGDIKNYEEAVKAIEKSLELLNVDYIDLMIIHSPQPWANFRDGNHYFEGNLEAWRALEEAYEAGKLRAIGVSNFEQADLENLINNGKVKPMVNQVLAHITNVPTDVIKYCQSQDIIVEAYSPIAHGAILDHPVVKEMAEKYKASPAQLSIRYVLQLGTVALPKTTSKDHMKSNADIDFTISEEDINTLNELPLIETYGDDQVMPVFSSQYNKK
ncbi:aldo/keto reductase [Carnobacterium inhibens]|uniref:2,5-diketo-D-gluconic acid reductase n=1 Tax=Carnobacterium inhibens subsp. gilichinskyi TaxID=1266845 RepID=U5SC61_9LACT|nr:aldo/keto reductase [Carnobacterium inhibens]AGY82601.1 2,5-diketo-D-gluconic acid reductase [Carnobacterium inhibens subsp. gilichinskyi]